MAHDDDELCAFLPDKIMTGRMTNRLKTRAPAGSRFSRSAEVWMRSHAVWAAAVADGFGTFARALTVGATVVAIVVSRTEAARMVATFLLVSHSYLLTLRISEVCGAF
jgi:hypothetical protein